MWLNLLYGQINTRYFKVKEIKEDAIEIDTAQGTKEIFNYFKNIFIADGYSVEVNNPYAGGFITRNYGNPSLGVNTIQIEINRKLYMNEKNLTINKNIIKIQKSFYNIFNDFHYDFKLAAE